MKSESERYSLLFENLPDAFACCQIIFNEGGTSRDCIFLEINTAFEKMIDLKREKVIGQKASAVLSETEKSDPFWNRIYDKVTSSKEPICFENYYEPQGHWYDVSLYRGEPDCFAVVFHDITDCKQAEKARSQSEDIYRQILDNVSDVIWTTNMDMETTYVSPSVEVMLGESVSEHMSKSLDQKFPPSSLEKVILIAQEEIEKEKEPGIDKKRTFLFEAEHYRADGSTIPVNMHLTFLRDDMGNISGLLGVTRDISKLKKAEKELQETDLDNLKKINDSLGHNEGDHYIQAAAEVLKSTLRKSDILARVGGDEFAVILPHTTLKAGRELVERIRHQIEIYNQQNTSSPTLSISIGIAVSTSGKQPLEKIYNKADDAMYEDKKQHRK